MLAVLGLVNAAAGVCPRRAPLAKRRGRALCRGAYAQSCSTVLALQHSVWYEQLNGGACGLVQERPCLLELHTTFAAVRSRHHARAQTARARAQSGHEQEECACVHAARRSGLCAQRMSCHNCARAFAWTSQPVFIAHACATRELTATAHSARVNDNVAMAAAKQVCQWMRGVRVQRSAGVVAAALGARSARPATYNTLTSLLHVQVGTCCKRSL